MCLRAFFARSGERLLGNLHPQSRELAQSWLQLGILTPQHRIPLCGQRFSTNHLAPEDQFQCHSDGFRGIREGLEDQGKEDVEEFPWRVLRNAIRWLSEPMEKIYPIVRSSIGAACFINVIPSSSR